MARTPYTPEGCFYTIAKGEFEAKPWGMFFWCTTYCVSGTYCDQQGSYHDPKKVHVVKDFPIPRTITNVRTFLGLTSYYRNFVSGYAKIVVPYFD